MSSNDSILVNLILKQEKVDWEEVGVTADMIDADIRPVFTFVVQHHNRYGKLPAREEVKKNFKTFRFLKASEPLEYYAERIKTNFQAAKLRAVLADAASAYNEDMGKALEIFKQGSDEIFKISGKSKVVDFAEALKRAPDEIETEHVLAADYPFGDPVLDQDLIGIEKGDWVFLAGSPAAGKTWWLLKLAYTLWRKHKLKILFISLELSTKIVLRRLYSIAAKIPYTRFRRHQMTIAEKERFRRVSAKKMSGSFELISAADGGGTGGEKFGSLEHIRQKIQKHKPDILMVDGIYLAMDMDKWGDTVAFANSFHMMLQELRTPAITTSQLKNIKDTTNPQLSDLAFTAAFQQATDFVFLMAKDPKMRQEHYTMVTVGKAREAEDCSRYYLRFNPGEDIYLEKIDTRIANPLMDGNEGESYGAHEEETNPGPNKKRIKKRTPDRPSGGGEEGGGSEEIPRRQKSGDYLSEEGSSYSHVSY